MHMITALKAMGGKLLGNWYAVAALVAIVALYLILVVLPQRANTQGQQQGQLACVAAGASAAVTHTAAQAASVASRAKADIASNNATGAQHERVRTRIETIYRTLETEARHAPQNPAVDACLLPPERLRIWAAANAGPDRPASGPDQSPATTQPDQSASEPASTGIGADARPGAQPPGGGPGLSPTGSPALRAAQNHGDRAP
jgi:hypothetical protein